MDKEYQLEVFKKNNFTRKQCPSCEKFFWTQDAKRTLCGDPPCVEYSFIGAPSTTKPWSLHDMREKFLTFFEGHGHTRVKRYPVVARWRDDIYLTIASIADFQPHVTSGEVPPPANPLTISQPCIRLNDIDTCGKTGRHLTTFEMMAHHAFNSPEKQIYWKDRTVELCHEFLVKHLGMKSEEITYKENPWSGGGNAGPAVEVLVRGLEVATLVFMKWVEDPNGPIEIKGERYAEMPLQIVDTGYGLERLVWASNGKSTIYEAIFPDVVAFLKDKAGLAHLEKDAKVQHALAETSKLSSIMDIDSGHKVLELRRKVFDILKAKGIDVLAFESVAGTQPSGAAESPRRAEDLAFAGFVALMERFEQVYALADHSRALTFMLGDGIVPSNVKAGYLMRMVLRKSLRHLQTLGLPESLLADLIDRHLATLAADFPELKANREYIMRIVELETKRYAETLEKGKRAVEREAKSLKGRSLSVEKLMELYDAQGLNPEIVKAVAEPFGVKVDIPDDFFTRVANLHSKQKAGEDSYDATKEDRKYDALPPSKLIYYKDSTIKDFEAVVLWTSRDGAEVVLDQTAFYPEGGGQPADGGVILTEDHTFKVTDVQKFKSAQGVVVVHKLEAGDGKLKAGDRVHGRVDWGKRLAHTRHHTATHVILGAARRVLGGHTWQAGAQKGADRSRVDIQHYQRISDEEARQIEQLANAVVLENLPVEKVWLPRDDAERKYGMQLYQGGIPAGREVRVVRVVDFD
ncbi:MAG: alanine--tRNA ligase, partial [Thermoplasmatota archaeon]